MCGPRLAYPIGQSTRFSEVIAESGREPGGHLLGHRRTIVPDGNPRLAAIARRRGGGRVGAHARVPTARRFASRTTWFPAERFAGIAEAYAETGTITQSLARFGVKGLPPEAHIDIVTLSQQQRARRTTPRTRRQRSCHRCHTTLTNRTCQSKSAIQGLPQSGFNSLSIVEVGLRCGNTWSTRLILSGRRKVR